MGQRLVINMMYDGEIIANAYYHWSAYTYSAAELTLGICQEYETVKEMTDSPLELAVELLTQTGAGLNDEEKIRVHSLDPNIVNRLNLRNCIGRNQGLLAITEQGIDDNESLSEGSVYINLDTKDINFYVYNYYHLDEFREEYPEDFELPLILHDPFDNATIDSFEKVVNCIKNCNYGVIYENHVYLWIE